MLFESTIKINNDNLLAHHPFYAMKKIIGGIDEWKIK